MALERSNTIVAAGGLAGGLIGGVAVNYAGVPGAFFINAGSFFVAAIASCFIKAGFGRVPAASHGFSGGALKLWTSQVRDGFAVVAHIPLQLWLCVLAAVINMAASPLNMALPVLVKENASLSPGFIGILNAAMGAGTILGSILAGWVCRRLFADMVIFAGVGVMGAGIAALFLAPGAFPLIAIMIMLGVSMMLVNVPISVRLMAATPDNFRSRVASVSAFMSQAAVPLGTAISGLVIAGYGMRALMISAGVFVVFLAPLLFLVPRFSSFFRLPEHDTHNYFLKNHPAVFTRA